MVYLFVTSYKHPIPLNNIHKHPIFHIDNIK